MTIATLTDVHNALNIPVTDTANDTELTYWLTPAEAMLVNWLKAYGGTLISTEQTHVLAEAYLAAWMFRRVREPPNAVQSLYDIAREIYMSYVRGVLMYPVVPGIAPMESTTSDRTTGGTGGSITP